MPTIAFPHRPQKHGGPGSFQLRMEVILKKRGWEIIYPENKGIPDVVFVVGGTRKLGWLLKQKLAGIPIVYRLDGINWLHRKVKVSLKKWFVNESRNILFQIIRSFFATHIVYQSIFVLKWWQNKGWKSKAGYSIIHNGVDIDAFRPRGLTNGRVSLLAVEGNIDYSPYAIELLNQIQDKFIASSPYDSLILYGGFQSQESRKKLDRRIDYRGKVARSELPDIYRNAVYLSLDVNAACPNTVIEALASGIPVIGFDTGALHELVPDEAGAIVAYGSDPWELGFPVMDKLFEAAENVWTNWSVYAKGAREYALTHFDMDKVGDRYIEIIEAQLRK